MTKHLRFLIVLLMTLVWSAGWAAESVCKTLSFPDDNKANNNHNILLLLGLQKLVVIVGVLFTSVITAGIIRGLI